MLNEENFKDTLLDIVDNPDNYTKDELYEAFLEITQRYLDELASTLNYERDILSKLGKERGEEEIEKISASNPALNELEMNIGNEDDKRKAIHDLLLFTECEFGVDIEDDGKSDID